MSNTHFICEVRRGQVPPLETQPRRRRRAEEKAGGGKPRPNTDIIPPTSGLQIGVLSHLESANRYAHDAKLNIDYEREFARAIRSLEELDHSRRGSQSMLLRSLRSNLPAPLCNPKDLLARCPAGVKPPKLSRSARAEMRSYLSVNRVVVDLSGSERTGVEAAAAAYEHRIGQYSVNSGLARRFGWAKLIARALPLMGRSGDLPKQHAAPQA